MKHEWALISSLFKVLTAWAFRFVQVRRGCVVARMCRRWSRRWSRTGSGTAIDPHRTDCHTHVTNICGICRVEHEAKYDMAWADTKARITVSIGQTSLFSYSFVKSHCQFSLFCYEDWQCDFTKKSRKLTMWFYDKITKIDNVIFS